MNVVRARLILTPDAQKTKDLFVAVRDAVRDLIVSDLPDEIVLGNFFSFAFGPFANAQNKAHVAAVELFNRGSVTLDLSAEQFVDLLIELAGKPLAITEVSWVEDDNACEGCEQRRKPHTSINNQEVDP
ncbi:hypothetical protein [Magnetospirillum molischianum]|uniref:Uncharacterized protein n=1 Tax=Magnetospirillum molischianum DSM 120 TaxID=1150626 RepID=H8FYD1_MAGML|nr:hypothetical protein [Magnetospirillum molischianum]CCG43369.1 hypothetical protein PHAMO_80160 [Magnetospirillum molischianum DSM 120]